MKNIKKAKNSFVYTIDGNKYYDLTTNSNIVGHSHRLLTTIPKNALSVAWNIKGTTIYHNRFRKFIKNIFHSDYEVFCIGSLNEFYLKMCNFGISLDFDGKDTLNYLQEHSVKIIHSNNKKNITDAAEYHINNVEIKYNEQSIVNGYWYPDINIPTNNAEAIILPEIFSGFTNIIFILVRKDCTAQYAFLDTIDNVASFTLICAMNLYYVIINQQKKQYNQLTINNNDIIQKGRIFRFKQNIKDRKENLLSKNILINTFAPQYNYLPINLEPYQIKYLNKMLAN